MSDIAPWIFFSLWIFAIVCCTELGWRIPVVRTILFRAEEERRVIEEMVKEENERRRPK